MRFQNLSRTVALALLLASTAVSAQTALKAEVYKSPYCGCCEKWVEHLKSQGFAVTTHDVNDVPASRKALGMPERFGSCHTAKIGSYTVEGHVPADDIKRLLREKPKAVGLAAPGMPQGSPGMETNTPQHYDTLLVQADGSYTVFAKH